MSRKELTKDEKQLRAVFYTWRKQVAKMSESTIPVTQEMYDEFEVRTFVEVIEQLLAERTKEVRFDSLSGIELTTDEVNRLMVLAEIDGDEMLVHKLARIHDGLNDTKLTSGSNGKEN